MSDEYLVVVSEVDPVAVAVADRWGTPPPAGGHVDGTPIRRLGARSLLLRRSGRHVHDERLDLRLPSELREKRPTLVFPSVHRSAQGVACLTVHPLGNPGPTAEIGGRPRTLVPTDPERMVFALRALAESAPALGLKATYEATHHGPELGLPAFFVEIGFGDDDGPPAAAVKTLAELLPDLPSEPADDLVVLAVGGGHYVPRFTDLALRRRWAFGHLLSRHVLDELERATAATALEQTPRARGILFARSEDAERPVFSEMGPRRKETEAARRGPADPTVDARGASGT